MHHPVRKYPGIPCLPQAGKFIQHIQNTNTVLVMQGHVHWSEDYTINDTYYSVGPSTSFQGKIILKMTVLHSMIWLGIKYMI